MRKISGVFLTRRDVELTIEHLVQEYGIERSKIVIGPLSGQNSVGIKASGGDAKSNKSGSTPASDAALHGPLLISVDVNEDEAEAVKIAFRDMSVSDISEE